MNTTAEIASHFRNVYFGGNWTSSNFKDNLKDITWQQAITSVYSLNSIASLVYHTNYYVYEVSKAFEGEPLKASDKLSFNLSPIQSAEDWEKLLEKSWADAEKFASLIEKLPDSILFTDFTDKKYGSYFRNLHGIVEHCHYHLGQIVLIKKILQQTGTS